MSTSKIIYSQYPGRITLTPDELAGLLAVSAHRIRLAVARGRWPIPHRRIGRRIMFPVAAVVEYLDHGGSAPPRRGPGRPRKADQVQANQGR
ncbi:helix-turn-helix domain-containing protein [Desulfurivibrio alkaliphilus]|uniref:helix-turn-helix domain-containing protein n=1 Tax=Desulfurivibrio alkaliphilus TaxID=427923 RepID=UPI000A0459D7